MQISHIFVDLVKGGMLFLASMFTPDLWNAWKSKDVLSFLIKDVFASGTLIDFIMSTTFVVDFLPQQIW